MSPDELTALWVRLTDELDFHHGKWFARDERGDWLHVASLHIHEFLESLGVGGEFNFNDPERQRVIRQFRERDRATTARPMKGVDVRVRWVKHRTTGDWRELPPDDDDDWRHGE